MTIAILGTLLVGLAQDQASYVRELAPIAFLAGAFEGAGKSPIGSYKESLTGEWILNKTALLVRTKSTMSGSTVFEDLRIFSYDNQKKKIRLRQYAMGDLAEYDVDVGEGGKTLGFRETSHEGRTRKEWRYLLTVKDGGFSYKLQSKEGATFEDYVSGALRRAVQ